MLDDLRILERPDEILMGKGQVFRAVVEYEIVNGKVNVLRQYVQHVRNVEKKRKAPVVVEKDEEVEL